MLTIIDCKDSSDSCKIPKKKSVLPIFIHYQAQKRKKKSDISIRLLLKYLKQVSAFYWSKFNRLFSLSKSNIGRANIIINNER